MSIHYNMIYRKFAFVFVVLLQSCTDPGFSGGSGGGGTNPYSFKFTTWKLVEFMKEGIVLIDKNMAVDQNISIDFQGGTFTLSGAVNACDGSFSSDGLTKFTFKSLTDCSNNCCDTNEYTALKSFITSVSGFELTADKVTVFFKKDADNYMKFVKQ